MRFVAITLAITALLVALLTSRSDDFAKQSIQPPGSAAVPTSETTQGASPAVSRDEPSLRPNDNEERARPPNAAQTVSSLPQSFTQNPEMHPKIVEYLVTSGLAATDAERTAEAVSADLKECVEKAFDAELKRFDEIALQSCTLNVASEYGLPVDDPTVRTTIGTPRSQ